jgi:hypothetical protein
MCVNLLHVDARIIPLHRSGSHIGSDFKGELIERRYGAISYNIYT